jgi:hypothetical protein
MRFTRDRRHKAAEQTTLEGATGIASMSEPALLLLPKAQLRLIAISFRP